MEACEAVMGDQGLDEANEPELRDTLRGKGGTGGTAFPDTERKFAAERRLWRVGLLVRTPSSDSTLVELFHLGMGFPLNGKFELADDEEDGV